MNRYLKKPIQNIAVFFLILIGLKNLFAALPLVFARKLGHFYMNLISPRAIAMHQVLSLCLGILILMLAIRTYKRVRMAWIIQMITLVATITLQIVHYHSLTVPIALIEFFVLGVLGCSYRDFDRKSDRITVAKAFGFISVSVFIVLTNATVGLFLMKDNILGIHDMYDAIVNSVSLLIFMNRNVLAISGKIGMIYGDSLIAINWICIISSAFLLLKPLVYNPIEDRHDKDRVRRLVLKFGQNPMSYLSLEADKKYFFGEKADGVCSYKVVKNVFVVCGDIICDKKDGLLFLSEILSFCNQNNYSILFLNITETFLSLYKMAGFGVSKYGEDACIKLSDYNLEGGKVAKVRAAINHANNAGISVYEYKPLKEKNHEIEHEIQEISEEWLAKKTGNEMVFMLGGVGLDDPLDRRYFYASDKEGNMLGFVVFLPYDSGMGYLADVTRRKNNAPQGVLEKIIYEAFMKMREEGVIWGNMGLSPLYNVAEKDKATITEKLFAYIYDNMSHGYDFKALNHAKSKYAPTDWMPRYLAYSPTPFSPSYAYAIVRAQVDKGLAKLVISELGK
ncbi:MAG: phosphatidylglycerol lysyltransferase domain-containing protein [Bacillota bacterium]|nr:phosphatidylglycerol lysyltransferase domain-containing protein [Bacillota bacterium]